MKADTFWAIKQTPSLGGGELAEPPDPSQPSDGPEFASALDGQQTPEEPRPAVNLSDDEQPDWDGRLPGVGKRLDGSGRLNTPPASTPSQQAVPWTQEVSLLTMPVAEEQPRHPEGADGSERRAQETAPAAEKRVEAPAVRLQKALSDLGPALRDESAAPAAPLVAESVLPGAEGPASAASVLAQAALEPGLNVAVLPRVAHILIGTEDGRELELHLRLTGERTEIRMAGSLTQVIRARLAELQLVLTAQGVPLAAIDFTEDEGISQGDPEDEPSDPDREPGVYRVFRTKA